MICAGIDAGSRTLKIVLLDAERHLPVAAGVVDQGIDQDRLALDLLEKLLHEQGLRRGDVGAVVATGYGRKLVRTADTTVTEITCQARGVRHCVPDARTIVDIGGQDSKLVRMKENGTVADFVMNDRCAAGTGRFLEMLAAQLGTPFSELESLVARSRTPAVISSMCVVFAESEIVGLLAAGVLPEDIVTGVQTAIATRIAAMTGRKLAEPVLFTGGVAMVPGMGHALQAVLERPVLIAPQPQLTCALARRCWLRSGSLRRRLGPGSSCRVPCRFRGFAHNIGMEVLLGCLTRSQRRRLETRIRRRRWLWVKLVAPKPASLFSLPPTSGPQQSVHACILGLTALN